MCAVGRGRENGPERGAMGSSNRETDAGKLSRYSAKRMGLLPTDSAICAGLDAPGRHGDAPMSLPGQRRTVVRSVLGDQEEVAVGAQEVAPGRPQCPEVGRPRL